MASPDKKASENRWLWFVLFYFGGLLSLSIVAYSIKLLLNSL